jgi:GNAT superfamily N-acetyltransferase
VLRHFVVRPRAFDHPDARLLTEAIQQYYRDIYGGTDRDSTAVEEFTPPDGLFLVGYLDRAPVACGGWRRRQDGSVEIKRMYVDPARRGGGLARRLLAELERTAGAAGASRVVLNTGYLQVEAIGFYEASGYVRTDDRFGVYEAIDGAYFFDKAI